MGCTSFLHEDALELILRLTGKKDGIVILDEDMSAQKPQATSSHDPVNHPDHYTQGGIECIDAIRAACTGLNGFEGYCTGNALKYLWRWKHKNGAEDLRKAGWYLGALIGETEGKA